MDEVLKNAELFFSEGRLSETLDLLNGFLSENPFSIDCLLLRVKSNYRLQRWGEVLNDINSILEKEPTNQVAINYKAMVLNIISYWNKDNFNP
jgi:hypothetical protein